MRITTTYKTNHNGTGQILAKGAGKQRTLTYDPALSVARNHGLAAGTLARVLIVGSRARVMAARVATASHDHKGNGYVFHIKV